MKIEIGLAIARVRARLQLLLTIMRQWLTSVDREHAVAFEVSGVVGQLPKPLVPVPLQTSTHGQDEEDLVTVKE